MQVNSTNPALATALSSAFAEVLEKGKDGFEHIVVLDRFTGEVLDTNDGSSDYVGLPMGLMEDPTLDNRIIFVHNHPGHCCPISLQDVLVGLAKGAPMFAVSDDDSVSWTDGKLNDYVGFRGPGWLRGMAMSHLRQAALRLGTTHAISVERDEDLDTLGRQQNGVTAHFAHLAMAEGGFYSYFFHYGPELEARIDEAAKVLGHPPCRQQKGWREVVEVAA